MRESLLLLSGGIDSMAIACWKSPRLAITIDYGQRSFAGELRAASLIAGELGITHEVVTCDLARFGSGDMSSVGPSRHAPVSEWWPFRNQLLITLAGVVAMKVDVSEILIGCVSTDARHVDGTNSFVSAIGAALTMQEGNVRLSAPAIGMKTVDLLRTARVPVRLLRIAFSCHTGAYACGSCSGCRKTLTVLADLKDTERHV